MATTQIAPTQNGVALDQFNEALRASPGWQDFIRQATGTPAGAPLPTRLNLTSQQRQALKSKLESIGIQFPKGIEIDQAGNVNQDTGFSVWGKRIAIGAAITGAALATMGAAGFGPLAGVMGGGGGAAAGTTGSLASAGAGGSLPGISGATLGGLQGAAVAGTGAGATAGSIAAGGAALTNRIGQDVGDRALKGSLGETLAKYGLQYGVPVAGALIGSKMQAGAEDRAAELENQAAMQALADARAEREYEHKTAEEQRGYSRGQYADYLGRLQPFTASVQPSMSRLEALLATGSVPRGTFTSAAPTVAPQAAAAPAMITVTAPTGETAIRPASERDHWISKGATVS